MTHRPQHLAKMISLVVILVSLSSPIRADDDDCDVPMSQWQPRDVVAKMAAQHGWTVRRIKIDEGCYEIYALDENGVQIEIRVNPATLEILEIEQEGDVELHDTDRDDDETEDDQTDD